MANDEGRELKKIYPSLEMILPKALSTYSGSEKCSKVFQFCDVKNTLPLCNMYLLQFN